MLVDPSFFPNRFFFSPPKDTFSSLFIIITLFSVESYSFFLLIENSFFQKNYYYLSLSLSSLSTFGFFGFFSLILRAREKYNIFAKLGSRVFFSFVVVLIPPSTIDYYS